MKNLIILVLLFCTTVIHSQNSFVSFKTFTPHEEIAYLDISEEKEVVFCTGSRATIEAHITCENSSINNNVIQFLKKQGTFDLDIYINHNRLVVSMPKFVEPMVNGKKVTFKVTYKIILPTSKVL